MMRLVAIQTMQVPREQETELGAVPIVGGTGMVTITRGWFQCPSCSVVGCFEPMASPMDPPPCPKGCEQGTEH